MTIKHQPDLVLLDIALPKMDGITVIKKIRKIDKIRNIPVIAVTASAMSGDRMTVISAGCDDYLSKPVEAGTLIACIERWLKNGSHRTGE